MALAAVLALGGASGPAFAAKAPEDPVEKHFKDLEKQIKQLRAIVTQARDSGQPVQVRVVTDPDPVVEGLQQKVDDLEQAARTRNEQIDTLTHDLDQASRDLDIARARLETASAEVARYEAQLRKTRIVAPIAGTVIDRPQNRPCLSSAASPVARVQSDTSPMM